MQYFYCSEKTRATTALVHHTAKYAGEILPVHEAEHPPYNLHRGRNSRLVSKK